MDNHMGFENEAANIQPLKESPFADSPYVMEDPMPQEEPLAPVPEEIPVFAEEVPLPEAPAPKRKRKKLWKPIVAAVLILALVGASCFGSIRYVNSYWSSVNAKNQQMINQLNQKIEDLQEQIRSCINALERIKTANKPEPVAPVSNVFDFDRAEGTKADAVADEISANLEALVGTTDEPAPTAAPRHPQNETTTSKFANLQFGRNYDPVNRG